VGRPSKAHYRADRDCWVARIDGAKVILARGRGGKADANRELRRLLAERDKGKGARASTATFYGLCDAFLSAARRDLKPLTFDFYLRHVGGFAAHMGRTIAASEVCPHHVAAWLAAHSWGPTTRAGAITSIKRLFNWAVKQGHLSESPVVHLEKPTPKARESILSAEQFRAILESVPDREFRDLLTAWHEMGARPSEVARIEAGMIDFDQRTVTMEGKTTGRTGRNRIILLTERAAELFRELATQYPEGPLLRNRRGNPWTRNATACRFARLRKKLGMGREATAESFRHGWATDALERGETTATVAALMGHRSTKMVESIYSKLHQRIDYLREAADRVRPGGAKGGED
jgi:integrase